MDKIAIIGDGGWGTTLAIHLFNKGFTVSLWGAFPDYVKDLDKGRLNTKFLPGIEIPRAMEITADLSQALNNASICVLAIPTQFMRPVLKNISKIKPENLTYVNLAKGIENKTLLRGSEIIKQILGNVDLAILSGPSIAPEVARGVPTTVVVSSTVERVAGKVQDIFINEFLRVYTNDDVIGVELGGAVKNIIAIAAGISDGMGFGANTKAAILTRGLKEIARFGVALGAKEETFYGISGLGDLVTTCTSREGRNRLLGEKIAEGNRLKDIIKSTDMVFEGIPTCQSVHDLAVKCNIEMPITEAVYEVLYKAKDPTIAVKELMLRERKKE